MGYLVPPARSVLFFVYFGDSGELKASLGFTNIFIVVALLGVLPTVAELTGDTHLYFPPVKHKRVSPAVHSVGCQCWSWDLLFTSLIKPSDLDLLSGSACICEYRAWGKEMNRKSSCSVVLSYQEYKTCKGEISGMSVLAIP